MDKTMKSTPKLLLSFFMLLFIYGCHDDRDDVLVASGELEIKNFIWRAMNDMYLYKADVPNLADDRFANQEELNEFLRSYSSPEELFYEGLVADFDDFSFLVQDYRALEKLLDGINTSNGMQYGVVAYPPGSQNVVGYVRYVLPNTSAEEQGVKRGDLFNSIDGVELNRENYSRLLQQQSYTIGMAEFTEGEIIATGETINLQKEEYTTNPVYIATTFETTNATVGYLMYNGFTGTFDDVLNNTFAYFKAEGVQELIVDLRYNGGGSVETASDLASMITGQFTGEIFSKEQWNEEYQNLLESTAPESLVNLFDDKIRTGAAINSLGLGKVYFITTLRTASASELVINGLKPYIDVIQVGENTTGKFQASTTLYDSPNFRRNGANTGHSYAVQPLIYKSLNVNNVTDYSEGLSPDVEIKEDFTDLGVLGDPNEPLLAAVLSLIEGRTSEMSVKNGIFEVLGESSNYDLLHQMMYTEDPDLPGTSKVEF
ncbi:S41 family peptidase [Salinimicrobium sp. MT39]|uniref:S41 family peptidase n=1 Tax=Salinimicrobium profundisediminis TaxID=2994553 RepID=A0A9X3HZ52_9FLAO|nr:S41 family peptidase [Salinimicrobium profundisediminis]MCX2836555.1 S41 family peptidase [Salinimicrobium profundisediminis]